jgi:hypothetical protein
MSRRSSQRERTRFHSSMSTLLERLLWTFREHEGEDPGLIIEALFRELETTHRIVAPDEVTDEMLAACFSALPEHYDPPDPARRAWHAFKAKRRYTAMVKAAKKLICTGLID